MAQPERSTQTVGGSVMKPSCQASARAVQQQELLDRRLASQVKPLIDKPFQSAFSLRNFEVEVSILTPRSSCNAARRRRIAIHRASRAVIESIHIRHVV
jgi:hypothetical protein